ncbi:MAG TPA: hypothetical protein VJV23_09335 [Candidatus Polarisedimenticolia bacterium]|nr:hypothetical protein [Candidatus Polarisedimenticolia bacterium]
MPRSRTMLLAAVAASSLSLSPVPPMSATPAAGIVHDFSSDPTQAHAAQPVFAASGPPSAFSHDPASAPRFAGDRKGSLTVTYDSLQPTARLAAPLEAPLAQDDDFVAGAILTIRPGIAADPFGFHPIAFSLFHSTTTGDDRTGDLSDFRSDTFDTVELAYFPNVSPFFGGPFLSPTVFGAPAGDDAFGDFAFAGVQAELRPGITYLAQLVHQSGTRRLSLTVHIVRPDASIVEIPAARAVADLSSIEGFLVDRLGISAYHDGFNVFSSSGRSLHAVVDYDLLYAGRLDGGRLPAELQQALGRFRRSGRRLESSVAGE